MVSKPLVVLTIFGIILCVGCSSNGNASTGLQDALPPVQPAGMAKNYISHVIVIIQENRSFENFFAGWPGANAPMTGCASPPPPSGSVRPTAATSSVQKLASGSGCPPGDSLVTLHQVTFQNNRDLAHDWGSSMIDWNNGQMDGFSAYGTNHGPNQAYAYIEHSQIEPYRTMAQQYVLADEMFPTEFGGSFTAHLTLVAGTDDIKLPSQAEVNLPVTRPTTATHHSARRPRILPRIGMSTSSKGPSRASISSTPPRRFSMTRKSHGRSTRPKSWMPVFGSLLKRSNTCVTGQTGTRTSSLRKRRSSKTLRRDTSQR